MKLELLQVTLSNHITASTTSSVTTLPAPCHKLWMSKCSWWWPSLTTQTKVQWIRSYLLRKCASLNSHRSCSHTHFPHNLWIVRSSVVKKMEINCILILIVSFILIYITEVLCKDPTLLRTSPCTVNSNRAYWCPKHAAGSHYDFQMWYRKHNFQYVYSIRRKYLLHVH
jgi:hypothetical protein